LEAKTKPASQTTLKSSVVKMASPSAPSGSLRVTIAVAATMIARPAIAWRRSFSWPKRNEAAMTVRKTAAEYGTRRPSMKETADATIAVAASAPNGNWRRRSKSSVITSAAAMVSPSGIVGASTELRPTTNSSTAAPAAMTISASNQ
jgi:hypothetical protein